MREAVETSRPLNKVLWITSGFAAIYTAGALACLRQWGAARPWSRLDVFSGGFLLLSLLWVFSSLRFHGAISGSREVLREASGMSYDPGMIRWIAILALAELTVFLDYGHWRLVRALQQPAVQWTGLALYLFGALWIMWVDTYLVRHFSDDVASRRVVSEGPYGYVRHPRYLALIVSRIAFAMALASVIGWAFVLAWLIIILRRIRLEEAHVRELFGAHYDAYAARTARLLPGIY